jgi:hypothetical protein
MEDGLFQILFFAVLIAASMFDAATRRRRRRKMEEMEREEGTVGSEQESEEVAAGAQSSGRTAAPEPSGRRETADSMVPADLWQILTGQQPFPEEPGAERPRSRTGSPSGSASPPEVGSPSRGDLPAGIGRGARGRPPGPESKRRAPSPFEQAPFPKMPEPAAAPTYGAAARVPTPPPPAAPIVPTRAPAWIAGRRSAGLALPYVDLLRAGGGRAGLRKAIVLTEVLGPPAALRSTGWDGGEL